MVCPSAWPAQGRRPAVCRLVSRQAYAGRGGGGGGGGGVGIYAGAVVITLAPLASLASSVVNFEFSEPPPFGLGWGVAKRR